MFSFDKNSHLSRILCFQNPSRKSFPFIYCFDWLFSVLSLNFSFSFQARDAHLPALQTLLTWQPNNNKRQNKDGDHKCMLTRSYRDTTEDRYIVTEYSTIRHCISWKCSDNCCSSKDIVPSSTIKSLAGLSCMRVLISVWAILRSPFLLPGIFCLLRAAILHKCYYIA